MIGTSLDRYRDVGLLIARVGFGLAFCYFHGYPKIAGGPAAWAATGDSMANLGITFGYRWWGLAAGLTEALGGLLFAAGFFFRPATLALAFVMVVATMDQFARAMPDPSHSIKNLWLFIGFFLIGPGRYSLDSMLTSSPERQPAGKMTV